MITPSRTLFVALLLPAALGAVAIADPSVTWPMLAIDCALVLLVVVDTLISRKFLLNICRTTTAVFSIGRDNRVQLDVHAGGRRRLLVQVTDDVALAGELFGLPRTLSLASNETKTIFYYVRPSKRGAYALGDHFVRVRSILGLLWHERRLPAQDKVRVYPDVRSLRAFDLLARQEKQYSMLRAVKRRGGETEFERLRDYTRDDEYRAIDWKATANKQRLIAREYQLESNQCVMFMLDAGRLMTAVVSGLARFDHALNATLMLAHVATRGADRVGLVGFDNEVRAFVMPEGGPKASRALIRATYDIHAKLVEPDFDAAFAQLAMRVRRRSLLILFTHVVDEPGVARISKRVRALSHQHLILVVLFRDLDVERLLLPATVDDDAALYVHGAAAEIMRWQERVVQQLRAAGALVLQASPQGLTTSVINRYLEIKARQLL